jgi:phage tail-like protein
MPDQAKSRYLDYLPAIYQQDPFLGQFLVPFDDVLAGFEDLLSDIDRYFAPALTDSEFLPWLASWVALALDAEWDDAKRRQLIGEAVELYRWRGTRYGLERYLEIYTELVPEIREWRWPGGMQIGVASRIGGPPPDDADAPPRIPPPPPSPGDEASARITDVVRQEPGYYDYYVVTLGAADGEGFPRQLYYRADQVEKVEVGDGYVGIWHLPPGGGPAELIDHEPATVTRRDGLIDDRYTLSVIVDGRRTEYPYVGDTWLIEEAEEERPYHFIVDVRVPAEKVESVQIDKVRAIVDLEKPAHTVYYLKLTPVTTGYVLEPMQVGVRSRMDLETIIG